jgi:putative flavoprotein involved in K+ transport
MHIDSSASSISGEVEKSVEAVVVGAGAAGLGAAASLTNAGIETLVLERFDGAGASWRSRYPALRLNTVRWMSGLPGMAIPASVGAWPSRDAFVDYLERFARHHAIELSTGVDVTRVDQSARGRYLVQTSGGPIGANHVVVATGFNRVPRIPDWPGRDSFGGELVHSSQFQTGTPYRDRDVLVVGLGNTGSELAVQLVHGGAAKVTVSMRTPPNILKRSNFGVPATVIGRLGEYPPAAFHDWYGFVLQRLMWGDLSRYGIGKAPYGIATEIEKKGLGPLVDNGFVALLKAGRVTLVPAVSSFDGDGVHLGDGSTITPEVVIVATGYHFGLEPLVGHLNVLRPSGLPIYVNGTSHPGRPGLYFNGYWAPLRGQLPAMKTTSRRIAREISRARRAPDGD